MKKLSKFGIAVMAILACVSVASCKKVNPDNQNGDVYVVQLGLGGELDVDYEPLTRAGSDDLYGIQVYSTPDNGEENPSWKYFAYGLFDNMENVTISLLKGYKYKFVATMVVDGKNKIITDRDKYYHPFNKSGDNDGPCAITNMFDYQATTYFGGLGHGNTFVKNPNEIVAHANTERYYGELSDYVPGSNGGKAKIKMKRVNFGAKFVAKGKAETVGSKLEIQIKNAQKIELLVEQNNKQVSDIFTFSNVAAAWAANGTYSEVVTVNVNWHREDGSVVPLGSHEITFKRNATTVINVAVVNDGSADGVGVEIDEEEFVEDGEEVTVEDGKLVDTEVDTNN